MIDELTNSIGLLDGWLQTMRQEQGYAGPVAHWWQNRFEYAGPGLDWRYEGILAGYSTLLERTGEHRWSGRIQCAVQDLLHGQQDNGAYLASRFEINPGSLGTPHEAAASLGLLRAMAHLPSSEPWTGVAKRNLDHLISRLWDERGRGFNDEPGVVARVPNKLATLGEALLELATVSQSPVYLDYARCAFNDVIAHQESKGRYRGAIDQLIDERGRGDGRFFPYYNARCIPPLVAAAELLDDSGYLDCAQGIIGFLDRTMAEDGSWPQVVYSNGKTAEWPRWIAGSADILRAYRALGERMPNAALERLLRAQLPSGGFPTAHGFLGQISQRKPPSIPDLRDVVPVVGWNDKVLRLLAELLPGDALVSTSSPEIVEVKVSAGGQTASYRETADAITVVASGGELLYSWSKSEPWARVVSGGVGVR